MLSSRFRNLMIPGGAAIAIAVGAWYFGTHSARVQDINASEGVAQSPMAVIEKKPRAESAVLALVLSRQEGETHLDQQIRDTQGQAADERRRVPALLRLGTLFISKARHTYDPGYYKLAEQCGLAVESIEPGNEAALLLRGHALEAMHHFAEAEAIARQLIKLRQDVLDYALLGDALMEQGRLDEAIPAYQQMADLKPCSQTYTRVAHVRWLKGDLAGAIEMMEQAVQTGTPRDPESLAWSTTHLGQYQLQAGRLPEARQLAQRAGELVPEYPPALMLLGRILLAQGSGNEAVEPLRRAVAGCPLPDYEWLLRDALRATGNEMAAVEVEQFLNRRGEMMDPRTFSLYLATSRCQPVEAHRLAEIELAQRRDIFSLDALAWSEWAKGNYEDAQRHSALALKEGTQDARLFLHAGIIAASAGNHADEALQFLTKAEELQQTLFPSEHALLKTYLASLQVISLNTQPKSHK